MASCVEAWWTGNYARYSLRKLQDLPLYQHFVQMHYPFDRHMDTYEESFSVSEDEDKYVWKEEKKQETLTHCKSRGEYHYFLTREEPTHTLTIDSWAGCDSDWGEVRKVFAQWTLAETWKCSPRERRYERTTSEQGIHRCLRSGVCESGERWVEEEWTQEGESVYKKSWEKQGQSGGESRMSKGEYQWGEEWFSDAHRLEKKCWHQERGRKWGSAEGKVGKDESWEHSWDFAPDEKFEEKITRRSGSAIGYRFQMRGEDWTKQEWEGALSDDTVTPAHLNSLYEKVRTSVLQSESTLKMTLEGAPEFRGQVSELSLRLAAVHSLPRGSATEALARIRAALDLQRDQEALKQSMQQAFDVTHRLIAAHISSSREAANDSLETLFALAKVAQSDECDAEVNRQKKEVRRLLEQDKLGVEAQLVSWKLILADMESAKRTRLRTLRKSHSGEESAQDLTLRQQELESSIQSAHSTFTRLYTVIWNFNELTGDAERRVVLEGLKRRFEGGQTEGGVAHLRALLAAIRSFCSIEGELLASFQQSQSSPGRAEEVSPSSDVLTLLVEAGRRVLDLTDLSEAEKTEAEGRLKRTRRDRANRELSLKEGASVTKTGLLLLHDFLQLAESSRLRLQSTVSSFVLKVRVLTEALAAGNPKYKHQWLLVNQQTPSKSADTAKLFLSLEAYFDLLSSISKDASQKPDSESFEKEVMSKLRSFAADLTSLLHSVSSDSPERISSLSGNSAEIASEYERKAKRELVVRQFAAVGAFFPVLREHIGKLLSSGPPDSSLQTLLSDAVSGLEALHDELHGFAASLSDQSPHLSTLRTEVQALLQACSQSPQFYFLPRIVSALRAYSPLLKARKVAARGSSDAVYDDLVKELATAFAEICQITSEAAEGDSASEARVESLQKDVETTFRDEKSASRSETLPGIVRGIRCFFPLLHDLLKTSDVRALMRLLHAHARETQRFAASVMADDGEFARKLEDVDKGVARAFADSAASPQARHFRTALKTLSEYHPLLASYWWKRAMDSLHCLTSDFDEILARNFPQCAQSLPLLRDKCSSLFPVVLSEYDPKRFSAAVKLLSAYHRLLNEDAETSSVPSAEVSPFCSHAIEQPEPMPLLEASSSDVLRADAILESEKAEAVASNLLVQSLQRSGVPTDKPLSYLNVFKFFEDLMDRKFEVDTQDLAALRKPRGMTEFLVEHLNRHFGIKSLAMKFLGQLLPGLSLLYEEKLPYAVLFARLLQVLHPDPIPFALAMFLVRVRMDFGRLMEKCTKEREVRDKRPSRKPAKSPVTYGRAAYDLAASGGEAFTSDVITYLYDLFDSDPSSGESALKLLRPQSVSLVDFVLFKLCHKMAKMGMSPEAVFMVIDADGGGSIDEREFVAGIASSLELWIAESDIKEVFRAVSVAGCVSKGAFIARCNFDWYLVAAKSEEFVTTKCEFLTVLAEIYSRKQRSDTAQLLALFASKAEERMSKATFAELLRTLDPAIAEERIELIWEHGLEMDEGATALSQVPFVKCMLKFPTGPFARTKFYTPAAEKAVEERRMETVDIDLKEMYAKKGGSLTVKTTTVARKKSRGLH